MPVFVPVAMQCLLGSFPWGHRLPPYVTSEQNYLTDNNLLIVSLLLETGGITGVISKRKI